MTDNQCLGLGLVAGEVSGDMLGGGLLQALSQRGIVTDAHGIGGAHMIEQGFRSLVPMEKLSVMGLVEVLKHLRELLAIRRQVRDHMLDTSPDLFIGIDSPDFNLKLEQKLRATGMRTVHYVSPTIWAWRQGRVKHVAKAVDLVMALFPFEADFYRAHGVDVAYVGHPLADRLAGAGEGRAEVRTALGLSPERLVLAVLPGSRGSEMDVLGPRFAATIAKLLGAHADLQVVAPMASTNLQGRFLDLLQEQGVADRVQLLQRRSQEAMVAADAVLLASGTAALEAMLIGRPMVVAYGFSGLTYAMLRRTSLSRMSNYSLPNILAGEPLVPEFIQDAASVDGLTAAVDGALGLDGDWPDRLSRFGQLSDGLRCQADDRAADAVLNLIGR